jgi:biopolymer transport protein TolR
MNRRPRRLKAEINVVPFIDVMLVLLIIFMVAAPMLQPGVVNLPSVDRADKVLSAKPLQVRIDAKEALEVVDAGQTQRVADLTELIAVIRARTLTEARPVVIAGDREVRYDAVVRVMDVLKKQGVERVGLAVQPAR